MTNFYDIIGVPKNASQAEIAKAYRIRSLACHPDRNPAGADAFKALGAAYEVLRDEEKRAVYDATGRVEGAGSEQPNLQGEDMDQLVGDFYASYRGSAEEVDDLIESFKKLKGDFGKMATEHLLFQNLPGEVERLRDVAKGLVESGVLPSTPSWEKTADAATLARLKKRMKREREEAAEALKELSLPAGGKGGKKGAEGGMDSLRAMILSRQADNANAFHSHLDDMEKRYAGKKTSKR